MYAAHRDSANALVCHRCGHTNPPSSNSCSYCTNSWPSDAAIEPHDPARHKESSQFEEVPNGVPMSFGEKCFSLEGRLGIGSYWLILFTLLIFNLAMLALVVGTESSGAVLLRLVTLIPCFWIALAVYAKRWHDLGQSGWLTLTLFIPFINIAILLALGVIGGNLGPGP